MGAPRLPNWQARLFTDMDPNERFAATSNIVREADNVNTLYQGCAERAINTLILINSGGGITVLAYIYHAKGYFAITLLSFALVIFVTGLLLALDVVARDFYFVKKNSIEFHGNVRDFMQGRIPFEGIRRFQIIQQIPDEYPRVTTILGELSAYCVVAGILLGFLGYGCSII